MRPGEGVRDVRAPSPLVRGRANGRWWRCELARFVSVGVQPRPRRRSREKTWMPTRRPRARSRPQVGVVGTLFAELGGKPDILKEVTRDILEERTAEAEGGGR